jgi:hypothetical protein
MQEIEMEQALHSGEAARAAATVEGEVQRAFDGLRQLPGIESDAFIDYAEPLYERMARVYALDPDSLESVDVVRQLREQRWRATLERRRRARGDRRGI